VKPPLLLLATVAELPLATWEPPIEFHVSQLPAVMESEAGAYRKMSWR
jgi:hypothetical protein